MSILRDLTLRASRETLPPAVMSLDSRSESPRRWKSDASIPPWTTALEIILCAMRVTSW